MNSLDIGILIIASIFFVRGVFRGFVYELVTVVGLILGYIISITYLSLLAGYISRLFSNNTCICCQYCQFFYHFCWNKPLTKASPKIITKTLKFAMLGWLNRLLGGVLGLLKSIIIMSILVFVIDMIPFSSFLLDQVEVQTSELYTVLNALGPRLYTEIQKITAIILPG